MSATFGARDHQRTRRASITLSALSLVLIGVGTSGPAVTAQDGSSAPGASPSASETPLPEGFSRRMARQVAEVVEVVPDVRDLPAAEGVSYRIVDQATFLAELETLFHEDYSDAYVAAEDAAFTRLGLIDADADLADLVLDLYDSQVLAYYDPRTTTFSLVGPTERIGSLERIVVAHEYGHALQDAAYDLEGQRITELDRADAILAQQALIEGDATAVMYDWAAREMNPLDLLRVSVQALGRQDARKLERAPAILRRQLEFPYLDGFGFVTAIRARGDWPAVDDVWHAQPVSTEQILHPESYPDELPVEVPLPDLATRLGDGWTTSYQQTMGEMQTGVWVADGRRPRTLFPGLPAQLPRADAAAGWGGDRLHSLDGPDGTWAVVWQTEWDTADDATEFRDAARDAVKDLDGAHAVTRDDLSGGLSFPVLVLLADGEETLAAVRAALAV